MRKTLMAVAVAGALTAPGGVAMAQTSTVQIFGTIHVIYNWQDSFRANNGNVPSLDHLTQSDSELGFRGEEQLGGGLSAWFQCASSFDVVGTGGTDNNNWCGRNSAVGLKGGWGNAFFGIWDTPEKLMIGPIRGWFGFATIMGGLGNVMENASVSGASNPGPGGVGIASNAGYARRQTRTLNYHSPSWGGFQVLGAYSATNEATASTSGQTANRARLWSAAGTYSSGPIYAGIAYEQHRDYNPGVGVPVRAANSLCTVGNYCGGHDYKWGIGGAYTFGGFLKLSGIYNYFKYRPSNGTELKAKSWSVIADWTIAGPHSLKAAYTQLRDTKGNFGAGTAPGAQLVGLWTANGGAGETGVYQVNVAYASGFSKRTTGSLGGGYINTDDNSRVTLPGGPRGLAVGDAFTVYGLGLRHSF